MRCWKEPVLSKLLAVESNTATIVCSPGLRRIKSSLRVLVDTCDDSLYTFTLLSLQEAQLFGEAFESFGERPSRIYVIGRVFVTVQMNNSLQG